MPIINVEITFIGMDRFWIVNKFILKIVFNLNETNYSIMKLKIKCIPSK